MGWLTKEQNEAICKDLLESEMTYLEICLKHNVCREIVRRRARSLGIESLTLKSTFKTLKECPLDLKQLILGSLLGDGCFCIYGTSKLTLGHLQIAHCMKQFPYLLYKFDILKKYGLASNILISSSIDLRFKDPEYQECRVKTRRSTIFTQVRKECYVDGKKHINFDLIEDLDELGLAIWYMDDGYVTKSSCIFSTCSFSYDEQLRLKYFLLGRFNLHFTIGKNDNSMYLLHEDFEKFKNLILPYVVECMKYKLLPYKERVLNKSDELLESCDANQQPSTPLTKCEGSETNS